MGDAHDWKKALHRGHKRYVAFEVKWAHAVRHSFAEASLARREAALRERIVRVARSRHEACAERSKRRTAVLLSTVVIAGLGALARLDRSGTRASAARHGGPIVADIATVRSIISTFEHSAK